MYISKKMIVLLAIIETVFFVSLIVFGAVKLSSKQQLIDQSSQSVQTLQSEYDQALTDQETYCGEYRELYAAFTELDSKSSIKSDYAIPRSAKGQIDSCYSGKSEAAEGDEDE